MFEMINVSLVCGLISKHEPPNVQTHFGKFNTRADLNPNVLFRYWPLHMTDDLYFYENTQYIIWNIIEHTFTWFLSMTIGPKYLTCSQLVRKCREISFLFVIFDLFKQHNFVERFICVIFIFKINMYSHDKCVFSFG